METMSNILSKKWLIVTNVLVALITTFFVFLIVIFVIIKINNDLLITSFPLRWSLFLGSAAGLAVSYRHIVTRNGATLHIRRVYAGIIVFIICTFVFSCYQVYQDTLLIKDVCTRYAQAMEYSEYETAYELMSPPYRQTHTLTRFIKDHGSLTATCMRSERGYFTTRISLGAREAKIFSYPQGSLIKVGILEKVDHKWYMTGEFQAWPNIGKSS